MSSARRRLRVALISFDFGEFCVSLVNALSRTASVALVLPARELETAGTVDPDVDVVPVETPRLRQPVRQGRMCWEIAAAVRRFGPDIVHLQQGHLWFNTIGLALLGDRPLVVTIHDHTPHPGDRWSAKTPQAVRSLAFRRARQVIVHADRLRDDVVAQLRLDRDRVHVVPLVAPWTAATPTETTDGLTVLFFGRIWPYKGLDHLIRAEPLVTERAPGAHFVIAGRGEEFARYRAMMRDPSRFTVLNTFVSNEQRAELFARAAVVVLPYVEASQSAVVPLAYAAGKPVVATTVGGLPEVVENERTGLLVPPGDERALADAIVRLLHDPTARRQMGAAGRRKLEREWSGEVVAEQTLRVYEAALAGIEVHDARRVAPALQEPTLLPATAFSTGDPAPEPREGDSP